MTRAQNQNTKYNSIDLVKFICAIMVVAIHVPPFGKTDIDSIFSLMNWGIQQYVSRLAVPFFFVCSGFFLFKKTTQGTYRIEPAKNYALRIFRLYVIWSIVYAPLSIRVVSQEANGIIQGLILYCRNIVFTGSYGHLWYLSALIVAVLLVSFLLYRDVRPSKIVLTAGGLYAVGLLGVFCKVFFPKIGK